MLPSPLCSRDLTTQLYFHFHSRAWHQARLPSAAIRLATHYLPLTTIVPDESVDASVGSIHPEPLSTPTPQASTLQLTTTSLSVPTRGTPEYYIFRLGGSQGLAQLFLAAGLLYLEGTATSLLSSSYAGLSSLRSPFAMSGPPTSHVPGTSADGATAWRRDRDQAARFFVRARALSPALDVPLLPAEETESEDNGSGADSGTELAIRPRESRDKSQQQQQQRTVRRKGVRSSGQQQLEKLEMPTIDVAREAAATHDPLPPPMRRRRRKEVVYASDDADAELSSSMMESVHREPDLGAGDDDRTWYLYLPGLVGAGTALLVVGLLSLQSWRKNQG